MTKPMLLTAIIGASPTLAMAQTDPRYFMPSGASNHADHIDPTMHFINGVTVFFFVLIIGLMLYFAIKYRRRSPHDRAGSQVSHNTALELSWSLPPAIIVIFMFYLGFQGFMEFDRGVPGDHDRVRVTARTWSWSFRHDNGLEGQNLHVAEGRPVRLEMISRDVIHSLYVPVFRVKRDVVPGRNNYLWFVARGTTPGADEPLPEGEELDELLRGELRDAVTAMRERDAEQAEEDGGEAEEPELSVDEEVEQRLADMGDAEKENWAMLLRMEQLEEDGHILYCAEYCGTNHSEMLARVVVHPEGWEPPEPRAPEDPVEHGRQLFQQLCVSCHQVPGAQATGVAAPSFEEGIFERERTLASGETITADRNYLRRSILNPAADVVEGYAPIMPPSLVTDEDELDALIEYLMSLP